MLITRLNWAGVLIQSNETTILLDPLGDTSQNQGKLFVAQFGLPREDLVPLSKQLQPNGILITHVHSDHFSPETLLAAFGPDIPLYLPSESISVAQKAGFTQINGMSFGDTVMIGELRATATYSMDGFGSPQIAWVVEGEGKKVIHSGDTLWHGYWLKMAHEFGPIDLAFLPINGAILEIPGLEKHSQLPACMGPEEAVEAAYLLGVKGLVPIHYQTFHNPPYYIETNNALERTKERAKERSVQLHPLQPKESLTL